MPYTNALIERLRADVTRSETRREAVLAARALQGGGGYSGGGSSGAVDGSGGSSANDPAFAGNFLTTITAPNGQKVTVNRGAAGKFNSLLQGLAKIYGPGKSYGGYANRNIAGTNKKSFHARGLAIDIDPHPNRGGRLGGGGDRYGYWDDDPRKFSQFQQLIRSLGMTWGGTWSNPDPMHFSIGE